MENSSTKKSKVLIHCIYLKKPGLWIVLYTFKKIYRYRPGCLKMEVTSLILFITLELNYLVKKTDDTKKVQNIRVIRVHLEFLMNNYNKY